MTILRSVLFNLVFFVGTFMLCVPTALVSLVAPDRVIGWARYWARLQLGAARVICGIRPRVSGWENLPPAPVLIASRHESTLDILVWLTLVPAPCFVVKRELTRLPLFGRCIVAAGMIAVDREAGGSAMRALLRGGDRAKAEGRHIIIFPEGTRVEPGERAPLQPGVAALAMRTGLPVVPVVTDSGKFWGRRAFRKQAGTVHIVIQPPLVVPASREAVLNALSAAFGASNAGGNLVEKNEIPAHA